jgi:hypothetical protein
MAKRREKKALEKGIPIKEEEKEVITEKIVCAKS